MVPRKEATLQNNTTIDNGILDEQDTIHDYAHADTRQQDNTPEAMQKDDDTEAETTRTAENQENEIKGNAPLRRSGKGNKVEYTKTEEQTEIIQLVEEHPGIPDELELGGGNRKHLSELMLEYPTKAEAQEELREQEKFRHYTCLKCKNPPKTPMGKTNRLRKSPESRQVPQKEKFINRCPGCNRTFKERHIQRDHRQYICAQESDSSRNMGDTSQDQANRESEQDEEQIEPKVKTSPIAEAEKRNKK